MATAKKAAKAKATDTGANVDDLLESKAAKKTPAKKGGKAKAADDVLETKADKKAAKKAPAKAKKAAKAEGVSTDAIRAFVSKCKKLTSYADVAEATGADLRSVRRTCRAMRDAEEIEIVKEGTVCFVKKA